MKKHDESAEPNGIDEMLPEYDFEGRQGVRGKYYQRYREGHAVRVRQEDGAVDVRHFQLEDGAVLLDPEVRAYFPDSEAVNRALRALIEIMPKRPPSTSPSRA